MVPKHQKAMLLLLQAEEPYICYCLEPFFFILYIILYILNSTATKAEMVKEITPSFRGWAPFENNGMGSEKRKDGRKEGWVSNPNHQRTTLAHGNTANSHMTNFLSPQNIGLKWITRTLANPFRLWQELSLQDPWEEATERWQWWWWWGGYVWSV